MRAGAFRRALGAGALLVLGAGATVAACFPSYGFGSGDDGGPGGGDGQADGTAADGASGDGTTAEGGSGGDGTTSDTSTDATAPESGTPESSIPDVILPPWDGSLLPTEVVIEGGTFNFDVLDSDGAVVHATATLDYSLAMDRTEVTVDRYQTFLNAGMPIPEAGAPLDPVYSGAMTWSSSWNTWAKDTNYASAAQCNAPGTGVGPSYGTGGGFPMNCVPWEQALAFCAFDHGRRLMTDTEWHVVASRAGGTYPWGSATPTCSLAIYGATSANCGWPVDAGSTTGTTPSGVYDLAGSLSEWVWDWLPDYYTYPAAAGTDYTGPAPVAGVNSRLWVGGSFWEPATQLESRASAASFVAGSGGGPGNYNSLGFRCVRSL